MRGGVATLPKPGRLGRSANCAAPSPARKIEVVDPLRKVERSERASAATAGRGHEPGGNLVKRTGTLITAVALLAGCAIGVERVQQLPSGTKILPVSLMGSRLAVRYVGTTAFQNARRDLDVPAWQIDEYAEAAIRRSVGGSGKFAVIAGDAAKARTAMGSFGVDRWTGVSKVEGGPESVIALARETRADLILVAGPFEVRDPFYQTNQSFSGYGIYQRSVFGLQRGIDYVTMRLVLFDGKTGAELARTTYGVLSAPRLESDWLGSVDLALSQANESRTRASIEQLIGELVRQGAADLKLD
jgi:hypothetical protein